MKIKFTFWKAVFAVVMLAGIYSSYVRFFGGLGASSAMTDKAPWGLWIAFDVLCGVMLAAGAFVVTGTVYILNVERLHCISRPAVLTAFLGYVLVIVGLMFDLGRPWFIWHQLLYMNPHSVMFEVGFCVMFYTTVLALEFSPAVLEKLGLTAPIRWIRKALIPLVVLGVILSTLHQSSLGTVFLIMPEKMHTFWYSPALPFFFFASAVAVGLAMTIFESSLSSRTFGRQLELPVIQELGRVLLIVLWINALLRFEDFYHRNLLKAIITPSYETYFLWLELILSLIVPLALLSFRKVRLSAGGLYWTAVCCLLGFVVNRLNVGLTAHEHWMGHHYVPKWTEVSITAMIIALGFFLFAMAVKYLDIFPEEDHAATVPAAAHRSAALPQVEPEMANAD
jgi:Ni/Fe-hydrogenase subunit HybB-like protein